MQSPVQELLDASWMAAACNTRVTMVLLVFPLLESDHFSPKLTTFHPSVEERLVKAVTSTQMSIRPTAQELPIEEGGRGDIVSMSFFCEIGVE